MKKTYAEQVMRFDEVRQYIEALVEKIRIYTQIQEVQVMEDNQIFYS